MKNIFYTPQLISAIGILIGILFLIICVIVYRSAVKFYVKELIAMYSAGETFFSKKRIESGIAFLFALVYTCLYVALNDLNIYEFAYVLTTWLFIAGYTVNMIQKEKAAPPSDAPKV